MHNHVQVTQQKVLEFDWFVLPIELTQWTLPQEIIYVVCKTIWLEKI